MSKLEKKKNDDENSPMDLKNGKEKKKEEGIITVITYNEQEYQEKELKNIEECFPFSHKSRVTWLNIDGLKDTSLIEKVGNYLGLHPLLIEDITNTGQRPKIEDFEDYIFIILKMIYCTNSKDDLEIEQISLILGPDFIVSFQERKGDVFESIREKIRKGKGKIRKEGVDYLAYNLIDSILDNYFVILENIAEKIEEIEERLLIYPTPKILQNIHELKRNIIFLRKSVWPLREIISRLEKPESKLIKETTQIYMRDIYDHSIQIMDTIETQREMISGMLDIYLSSISNKMNEVMKVLTIIATIFIPLTFIAGIYGMNFHYMPELSWRWGYFATLLVMVLVGVLMVFYFRKKKWL
ncbi:MAG: magnesium/cobalt transporter CorA [Candidatus Caldatribacteriota bacterium]